VSAGPEPRGAVLRVRVPGRPVPQGSLRIVAGRAVNPRPVDEWRARAALAAAEAAAAQGWERATGPVAVDVVAVVPRPAGHYGTGRNAARLRPSAPAAPAGRPDLDKIVRAVLDAVTGAGCVWADDAQVVDLAAQKLYPVDASAQPGVVVYVTRLDGDGAT